MSNRQGKILQAVSVKELSDIREIIQRNKTAKNNAVLTEYGEWYSSEGESFQTSKIVGGVEYLFEVNSVGELLVLGKASDLMRDE